MRVVHISATDIAGGAAKAAYRLHQGLCSAGIDSLMWVQTKHSDARNVHAADGRFNKGLNLVRPILEQAPQNLFARSSQARFSYAWLPNRLSKHVRALEPDIVHLHWIGKGVARIESLPELDLPIVWTLHDIWPITGGCHIVGECDRYIERCGNCPQIGSNRQRDLSRWVWMRKSKAYEALDLTFVAPSRWLADCVMRSSLGQGRPVQMIHHGIDTTVFKPADKALSRDLLGIPMDAKIVLFGAVGGAADPNKGFFHLQAALRRLMDLGDAASIMCVVFGSQEPPEPPDMGVSTQYLGRFHDEISLSLLYSAADVTVVPSLQEAFGQTALESLACGTPVVSFDTTGLKDIIEHKSCGYRANCFDATDLASGIAWVLADDVRYQVLSLNARARVEQVFFQKHQVREYIKLYSGLLR